MALDGLILLPRRHTTPEQEEAEGKDEDAPSETQLAAVAIQQIEDEADPKISDEAIQQIT